MALLRLIRWTNLLIVFLTQALAWCCVVWPVMRHQSDAWILKPLPFLAIAASTVVIAAAGYIINDYFDIRIDAINRPGKVILEHEIKRRDAIILHSALNALGLFLAVLVARKAGHYEWVAFQLLCTVLLWFYSTHFKRQFMTGNVVVALLTALTIVALILYEKGLHSYIGQAPFVSFETGIIPNPVWVLGVYAGFAFVLTWMREIVKDMEDYKGDAEEGCVTMPIRWGLKRSAQFTQLLSVLAIVPLAVAGIRLIREHWLALGTYALVALVLPLLVWTLWLNTKATTAHYHRASRWLKIIMVLGIGSLLLYYFQTHG